MIGSFDPGFVMQRQKQLEIWIWKLLTSGKEAPSLTSTTLTPITSPLNPLSSQTIRQFLTLRANREPKELKMNPASLEAEKTRQQKEIAKRNQKFSSPTNEKSFSSQHQKIKLDSFELTQVIGKGAFGGDTTTLLCSFFRARQTDHFSVSLSLPLFPLSLPSHYTTSH